MVKSTIDTDAYKLSMQNAVCNLFPREIVRYDFFNRGKTAFPEGFGTELQKRVEDFRFLALTRDEKDFLREKCYYLSPVYLDFLMGYRFDPSEVTIEQKDEKLTVFVTGPWYRTILWETPLMATISELYFKMTKQPSVIRETRERTNKEKFQGLAGLGVKYADFGARRRYSFDIHDEVVSDCIEHGGTSFVGTSNPYLAMKYNSNPIGTQAHEWFMFHAAKYGYARANELAMKSWVNVYNGDLGIVLPDTFTTDAFLKTFDTMYAKLYDGARQDSGSPYSFADKLINHYKDLRIDPTIKTIIFSDSIKSLDLVDCIHKYCSGKIRDSYGIGTWFTNDVGVQPLNIVIKLTGVLIGGEWRNTIKLSDTEGKHTGPADEIDLCKRTLKIA